MARRSNKHSARTVERDSAQIRATASAGGPPVWVAATMLAICVAAVYGPKLDVPFILDDQSAILRNPSILSLWPLIGAAEQPGPLRPVRDLPTVARPLVNLSFAINYYISRLNPAGYHAANALLHFLSTLLLWAILRRTLRLPHFKGRFEASAGWLALAAALLWALHPLNTEAVIYATQRTELMMAFFYLATLYCSLRYWATFDLAEGASGNHRRRSSWLLLAILSCLCGMASKEVMVSAPLVVLLFDRAFVAGSLRDAFRRSWPLYLGLASTWILLLGLNLGAPRGASAGFNVGISAWTWWLTQCKVLFIYVKLAIWPSPLLLHYELPYLNSFAGAWMYAIPVLLLAILAVVLLVRNTAAGFLLASFAAVLAPTFLVPIPTEMAAERRMYLPLAALVVLVIVGCHSLVQSRLKNRGLSQPTSRRTSRERISFVLPVVLLAIACGVASAKRLNAYYDESYLWQQVLRHQPNNYLAHYNLGIIYNHAGRESESMAELQAAVAAKPDYAPALSALGFALIHAGQLPEAIQSLNSALTIAPDYVPALNNRGLALIEMGRFPEAIEDLQHALELDSTNTLVLNNLARALSNAGRPAQAMEALQTAQRLTPEDPDVLHNLGMALAAENRLPEAIEHLQRVVELRPDFVAARNNLGIVLFRAGYIPQSIEQYHTVLRLKPDLLPAYFNLAEALMHAQRTEEAVRVAKQGMAAARTAGDSAAVGRFEEWLKLRQPK
jgi:Tfp pilus assembly protein PilF